MILARVDRGSIRPCLERFVSKRSERILEPAKHHEDSLVSILPPRNFEQFDPALHHPWNPRNLGEGKAVKVRSTGAYLDAVIDFEKGGLVLLKLKDDSNSELWTRYDLLDPVLDKTRA
eukprot:gene19922-7035_t